MSNTILQTNATPIYAFLSFITRQQSQGEFGSKISILDCGAGGAIPPISLFREYGFEVCGIDISDRQLTRAKEYCEKKGLDIDLRKADMRQIPFEDERFDCVYEHYSMCHLSKLDTAVAINEMFRVTRKGGLCFIGMISVDTWPKYFFGKERETGEFWEDGERHSMFTDQEADELVSQWQILTKEKRVIYLRDAAKEILKEEWGDLTPAPGFLAKDEKWQEQYAQRQNLVNYSHIYYILKKV